MCTCSSSNGPYTPEIWHGSGFVYQILLVCVTCFCWEHFAVCVLNMPKLEGIFNNSKTSPLKGSWDWMCCSTSFGGLPQTCPRSIALAALVECLVASQVAKFTGFCLWHFFRWMHTWCTRWWFEKYFFNVHPKLTWGWFPIWLIFFKWVETTN